jgi:hypothetical protein
MSKDNLIDENMARVGLKAALIILDKWQCNTAQIEKLLDLKVADSELKSAPDLTRNQQLRISYILNIHATLQSLFSNTDNIYGYMTMINHNAPFHGSTPLDFAMEHDGLKRVMEHVLYMGQW